MHMKESMRNKQLPEVGRGGKSGVTVARAEEPHSSRQVDTRNPRQTGASLGETSNQNPAKWTWQILMQVLSNFSDPTHRAATHPPAYRAHQQPWGN